MFPESTHGSTDVITPSYLPGSAPFSLASEWRRTAAAPFGYRYNSPLLNRVPAAVPLQQCLSRYASVRVNACVRVRVRVRVGLYACACARVCVCVRARV